MTHNKKGDANRLVAVVNFRMSPGDLARLRDLARRSGKTLTDLIRDTLTTNVFDDDQPKGKTAGR